MTKKIGIRFNHFKLHFECNLKDIQKFWRD